MRRFPRVRALGVPLPSGTADRMRDEALKRWGDGALDPHRGRESWLLLRLPRQHVGSPFGGCRVQWETPTAATATIVEIGWSEEHGGSEENVLSTLNGLVGAPVLR